MKPDDKTPDSLVEAECTTVSDNHEGDESTDVVIGANRPGSIYQLYSDHLNRVKEKAAKKENAWKAKKKRKKKKKKKQKKNEVEYLPPMTPCENIGVQLLPGHEILSPSESALCCRNQMVSAQIRCAQGRVVSDQLLLRLDTDSGVLFGMSRDYYGYYIGKRSAMDGHICVIGESGRGKTESIVKPTMLTSQNSSNIIFDFKDNLHQHWIATAKLYGKRCVVFCPDAPSGCSCHYDPLEPLRRNNSADIVAAVTDLVRTLIPLPEGTKEPIWIETARNYLIGVILYYYPMDMSFPDIMLLTVDTPVTVMIKKIMENKTEKAALAKIFINKLTDVEPKIISNIGMELNQLVFFATDQNLIDLLKPAKGRDLLDWYAISTSPKPIDVIIAIPEAKLDYYKPILRLMANQLIKVLEQRPQRTFNETELPPVLVLMDEFARLGKIPSITNGLMTLRSSGVTFSIFIQSIASLDEVYGHNTARIILENCIFKVILGASDVESQNYCSNLVGSVETPKGNINEGYNFFTDQVTGYSRNISTTREPIIYPHEFGPMSDMVIVSPAGYFRVDKVPYYSHKELFIQRALLPRYKKHMEEYDRTHALSALPLPERRDHHE